jgi:N-acetylglucosamine-6-phosphate deacetylase
MLTICGRHYENGEPVRIAIEGERIVAVEPAWPPLDAPPWHYVAPGLFDLQINGHGGVWFGKIGITVDEVRTVLKEHFRFGVTRLCPTLITNSFDALAAGFAAIRQACERE